MSEEHFTDFILNQLHDLCQLRSRAMFGGQGLYNAGRFFGIIHDGHLYLRTTEQTREHYRAAGMQPFSPNEHETLKHYYEVPDEVLNDTRQLIEWALDAIDDV